MFPAALLMALVVALPSLAFAQTRGASSHTPTISFGTGVIAEATTDQTWDVVWMGTYDDTDDDVVNPYPVPWNVFDPANDYDYNQSGHQNGVFMVSTYTFGNRAVYDSRMMRWQSTGGYAYGTSGYNTSNIRSVVLDFMNQNLTADEIAALGKTYKTETKPNLDGYASITTANILGDKMFVPSAIELMLSKYGFNDLTYGGGSTPNGGRSAAPFQDRNGDLHGVSYWMRNQYMYLGDGYGFYSAPNGNDLHGLRPACNVRTDAVLFTIPAQGGKSNELVGATADSWPANDYVDSSEWRFTLRSSSQAVRILSADRSGDAVTIDYENATYGANEYLSAIIVSEDGHDIISYGKLRALSTYADKSGSVGIVLPEGFDANGYTLQVFCEQCNGDYYSDYASDPVCVTPSTQTDILSYGFDAGTQVGETFIDRSTRSIYVTVTNDTNYTNIIPNFQLSSGARAFVNNVEQISGSTAVRFNGPLTYVVVSADLTTGQDWTVYLTTPDSSSSEKNITSFTLDGVEGQIDQQAKTISVTLPFGTDLTRLFYAATVSEAALLTSPIGAVDFTGPVEFTVRAQDGSSQVYTVTATVEDPLTGNDIVSLSIDDAAVSIDGTTRNVLVTYPYGTATSSFSSKKPSIQVSEGAQLIPNDGKARDFRTPQKYYVVAQDSTIAVWTVTFTVAKNDAKDILTFTIDGQEGETVIDSQLHRVTVTMPSTADITVLQPRITVSPDATISPKSGRTQDFSSPVPYTVTAQDGSTQVWIATVVGGNVVEEADLLSFVVAGRSATIDQDAKTVSLELPAGTSLMALKPVFVLSNGAAAFVDGVMQISNSSVLDFTQPVVYQVVSSKGQVVNEYTVTISVYVEPLSSGNKLLSFQIAGVDATIDDADGAITATVPYGTDLSALAAQFTASEKATVSVGGETQESGVTVNDFTEPVQYLVTAEDGSQRTYVVTVDVEEPVLPAGNWRRLSGSNRYGSMAAVVQEGFATGSCDTVVVASGASFPDALAASGLAGLFECPVILTNPKELSSEAASQIRRLGATKVYVLGGTGAVAQAVVDELYFTGQVDNVERLAGANRQATAIAINDKLKELGSTSKTAVIACGSSFADSLSISPYCYATASPIFLTESNGRLSDASLTSLRAFGPENIVIVGGSGVVSDVVQLQLGPSYSYIRLAGSNRYQTSAAIAAWEGGGAGGEVQPEALLGFANVALATGTNFPDGLAAGALCGVNRSVLVLVSDDGAGFSNVTDLVGAQSRAIDTGYLIGGTGAVSQKVQDTVEGMNS